LDFNAKAKALDSKTKPWLGVQSLSVGKEIERKKLSNFSKYYRAVFEQNHRSKKKAPW
jgi:hypothetical protein